MAARILQISTDEKFSPSLNYIAERLSAYENDGGISITLQDDKGRHNLSVDLLNVQSTKNIDAATMSKVRRLARTAIDALAEVVITDLKFYYIQSRLKLPIDNEVNRHAFIKALSTFDSTTDKMIAQSLIKLTPNFLLDSFYEFMIDTLKIRWQEVCSLANENICYLVCGQTFNELLRFLISNIDSICDEAHVLIKKEKIEVLGRDNRPFDIYINESLPLNIQVVTKLVAIAPKKIYLHQETLPFDGGALAESIRNLFGSSVLVMEK